MDALPRDPFRESGSAEAVEISTGRELWDMLFGTGHEPFHEFRRYAVQKCKDRLRHT